MYDPIMVQPMREEVTGIGFRELMSSDEVKTELSKDGTTFIFVNSVCGCAAGKARPGLSIAVEWAKNNNAMPDNLVTVFAGMEKDAVTEARNFFTGFPPSSPQMAMLKDGEIVHMINRMDIENNDANAVANLIANVFNKYCKKEETEKA
ncbi:MAG TPA: BrxA/BrxB family bacilliredoxin [Ignavibacteria bacterium]|nr:BrxA/BrxB family bacilliredoxin [Ignavibacteria bacterium]HQY52672.1 BrxA/BrxB family bacilliredoxin [Ignavibacteria bacterium]HRB00739.1 BrxA/BrxB family bacilliredoxin [Ignavibacteria bacterium]